jgi:hypothetical protein
VVALELPVSLVCLRPDRTYRHDRLEHSNVDIASLNTARINSEFSCVVSSFSCPIYHLRFPTEDPQYKFIYIALYYDGHVTPNMNTVSEQGKAVEGNGARVLRVTSPAFVSRDRMKTHGLPQPSYPSFGSGFEARTY